MIYVYKCLINPKQYSRCKKKSHKKSCAHEIIHFNNMHGTKHTTEFICVRLFILHFRLFIKKPPPPLLSRSAFIHFIFHVC